MLNNIFYKYKNNWLSTFFYELMYNHKATEYMFELNYRQVTYLRGFARILCPIVTKLVSWLDMNQAREETLEMKI